jgi:hypothetical protein
MECRTQGKFEVEIRKRKIGGLNSTWVISGRLTLTALYALRRTARMQGCDLRTRVIYAPRAFFLLHV